MSELLDRIHREIRERLAASRAAVHEHERLEAALQALGDAGSRATRAVTGRGDSARASSRSARPSSSSHKPANAAARSSKRAAPGGAKRAATADGEGGAVPTRRRSSGPAPAQRRSGAAAGGRGQRASRSGAAPAMSANKTGAARATSGAAPARKRAAPGANRDAVLRVIGERPGITARELAAASQVTGGTLYTLLRRLVQERTLEKRELPGGQTGYAIAASAASAAQAATTARPDATTERA